MHILSLLSSFLKEGAVCFVPCVNGEQRTRGWGLRLFLWNSSGCCFIGVQVYKKFSFCSLLLDCVRRGQQPIMRHCIPAQWLMNNRIQGNLLLCGVLDWYWQRYVTKLPFWRHIFCYFPLQNSLANLKLRLLRGVVYGNDFKIFVLENFSYLIVNNMICFFGY